MTYRFDTIEPQLKVLGIEYIKIMGKADGAHSFSTREPKESKYDGTKKHPMSLSRYQSYSITIPDRTHRSGQRLAYWDQSYFPACCAASVIGYPSMRYSPKPTAEDTLAIMDIIVNVAWASTLSQLFAILRQGEDDYISKAFYAWTNLPTFQAVRSSRAHLHPRFLYIPDYPNLRDRITAPLVFQKKRVYKRKAKPTAVPAT